MRKLVAGITLIVPFIFPDTALAHAFGQIYSLPIPVWIFLYGGAIAVGLSFILVSLFLDQNRADILPTARLPNVTEKILSLSPLRLIGQVIGLGVWLLIIVAGLIGT